MINTIEFDPDIIKIRWNSGGSFFMLYFLEDVMIWLRPEMYPW